MSHTRELFFNRAAIHACWTLPVCAVLTTPIVGLFLLMTSGPRSLIGPTGVHTKNLAGSVLSLVEQNSASIVRSLNVAVVSSTLAVLIGTALAVHLWFLRTKATSWLLLISLPAFLPPLIVAIGGLISFSLLSIYGGVWRVTAAHTVICCALTTPLLLGALRNTTPSLIYAAQNLGVPLVRAFAAILLGWQKSTLIAAWLVAFAFSWNEFIIAWFLGGSATTLPVALYQSLASRFDASTATLALIGWSIALAFCFVGVMVLRGRLRNVA